jgi:hypothetical protein
MVRTLYWFWVLLLSVVFELHSESRHWLCASNTFRAALEVLGVSELSMYSEHVLSIFACILSPSRVVRWRAAWFVCVETLLSAFVRILGVILSAWKTF